MELEFWFSIGSTYTYLTVMRMKEIERKHNISLRLMPFSVRQIMLDMNNAPFPPSKASKVKYMWRDIERRAQRWLSGNSLPIHSRNLIELTKLLWWGCKMVG